jgi:lipopolysaccharide/colanic/teichoic acid biosynthesis glycosyltransferase
MAEQHTWHWPGRIAVPEIGSANDFYLPFKRCIDILCSCVLIILLFPVFLLIVILIKMDSDGSVIYKQERVGARRKWLGSQAIWIIQNFQVYKFRSMKSNADPSLHEAYIRNFVQGRAKPDPKGGKFKLTNDPRVTRVGRLLRKFSLDELPQLFNVLRGEMSLVGPRPVPPYEVSCYKDSHHQRLAALPGITGLWQVKGRGRVTFEEMIRMDIEYVRNISFLFDLKILFLTIPAVLSRKGAE